MKKLAVGIAVLGIALLAANAMAFKVPGAPSEVNRGIKQATDMGVKQAAKDKFKNCPCTFPSETATNGARCCGKPFETFVSELGQLKGLNDLMGNRMYISAQVEGKTPAIYNARDSYVTRNFEKINKWYRVNVRGRRGGSQKIAASVQ